MPKNGRTFIARNKPPVCPVRYDGWQMGNELQVKCISMKRANPNFKCNTTEVNAVLEYGEAFDKQFKPVMDSERDGCFLTSCIVHGTQRAPIAGKTSSEAFALWYTSNTTGAAKGFK